MSPPFAGMRSIKSKMALVVVVVVAVLSALVIQLSTRTYRNYQTLQIAANNFDVDAESDRVDQMVRQQLANARELALAGELLYRTGADRRDLGILAVTENFRINSLSVGGGIWYEPWSVDPARERVCYYAFDDGKEVVYDPDFESEAYHYPTQSWYTAIRQGVRDEGRGTVRTPPYFDDTGTHALMTTIGCGIFDAAGKFVGMSTVDWKIGAVATHIATIRPTPDSYAIFVDIDHDYILAMSDRHADRDFTGEPIASLPWLAQGIDDEGEITLNGATYITYVNDIKSGLRLFVLVPKAELFQDIDAWLRRMIAIFAASALLIAIATYLLLDRFINRPVAALSRMAEEIGAGNLDAQTSLRTNDELGKLAETFNRMTIDIRGHIEHLNTVTAEKERIKTELDIATEIQASMLPSIFPPFPEHKELDIYATMDPAREVGGDFYDFFMIDGDHLAVVIADVSDKGVPAALFMVVSKTLIKDYAMSGIDAGEAFTQANARLCENNPFGMFVTAFIYILNLRTGEISCVNAGHNPPLLRRAGGSFERLPVKPDLVLGAMDDVQYRASALRLSPGDFLFLYTDGVTEATNPEGTFFGEARLLEIANRLEAEEGATAFGLLTGLREAVDTFADGAPQNDDITMVGLLYRGVTGAKDIKELSVAAEIENLPVVMAFVEDELEASGVPMREKMQVVLAVEELCANVANHATAPGEGRVTVRIEMQEDPQAAVLRILDDGAPFNPLEAEEPDVTLPEEERAIGGLGIFLAKKNVDQMTYEYRDGLNTLTLKKFFRGERG